MSDYLAMRHAVIRESATEKKIRSMDVSDIVELIHRLEDEIDELESMLLAAGICHD